MPAVLLHDGPEVLAEGFYPLALGDGVIHSAAQIREQVRLHGAGDDEGPIMGPGHDVVPALGRQVELLPEEVQLLGEGGIEADGHSALSITSAMPLSSARAKAEAMTLVSCCTGRLP